MEIENNEKKSMKIILKVFYIIVFIGIIFGIYSFLVDKYTVYMVNDEMILNVGDIGQVDLLPKNINYYDLDNYVFSSDNKDIVFVDNSGFVQGMKEGTANVKVRYKRGIFSQKIKIKVEKITINSLKLDDSIEVEKNITKKVKAVINNDKNINANLQYSTDDETIIKVDNLGNVTGLKSGSAKLIASSEDGTMTSTTIKVTESKSEIEEIRFLEDNIKMDVDDTKELQLEVYPVSSNTDNIVLKSSNPDVVSIDSEG